MGKPLSAEHKAKISAALKARNAAKGKSGGSKAPSKPSGLNGRDSRSMSGADKAKAAETMYGTGSKQHKAAVAKFGDKPAAKRGPVKSDKSKAEIARDRDEVAASIAKANRQGPTPKETESVLKQQRETQAQMDKIKSARAARGQMGKLEARVDGSSNARYRRIGKRSARAGDDVTVAYARGKRAANTRQRRSK